jgi:hypothetical protein
VTDVLTLHRNFLEEMEEFENDHTKCVRCEENLEDQVFKDAFQSLIKLTDEEISFITVKFGAPLCIPCLNQLKTSYKIIKGEYNFKSNQKLIS